MLKNTGTTLPSFEFHKMQISGEDIEDKTIDSSKLVGLETSPETKSANYAFIKGPSSLTGLRIGDPEAQKIILEWIEKERSQGRKLVGAFDTSLSWLFEVIPNSVRFITDDD